MRKEKGGKSGIMAVGCSYRLQLLVGGGLGGGRGSRNKWACLAHSIPGISALPFNMLLLECNALCSSCNAQATGHPTVESQMPTQRLSLHS